MNNNPLFYKGLIWCFGTLYLLVAFISFWHCIAFCLVGNPIWISVMMSFAFEVGLAATLFSILTTENKSSYVSWMLMTFLTGVQVIGNVYSVYKYMVESGTNFYTYIQDSMLHWFIEDVPTIDIMSIISIILGALLPIVALLMTAMASNNLKLWLNRKYKKEEIAPSEPIPDNKFSNLPEVPVTNPDVEEPEISPEALNKAIEKQDEAPESDLTKTREEFYKAIDEFSTDNNTVEITDSGEDTEESAQEEITIPTEEATEDFIPEEEYTPTGEEENKEEDFNLDFKEEKVPDIPIQEAVVTSKVADVSLLDIDNNPAEQAASETIDPLDPSCGCKKEIFHNLQGSINGGSPVEVRNTNNPNLVGNSGKANTFNDSSVINTSILDETIKNNVEVMRQQNGPFSVFRPRN